MKKIHQISGIVLSLFVSLHFCNHLMALSSVQMHIDWMNRFRLIYQNPFIEPFLLFAILAQIVSGIQLVRNRGWRQVDIYNKIQVYSGIYLGFFLLMHTSATLVGRFLLLVDTNFYYAAMVVNIKPIAFFYVPYYMLGTLSFFAHIACVLRLKSMRSNGRKKASRLANGIMVLGLVVTLLIIFAFTYQITLPQEYVDLVNRFIG
ncbi:hypothetical protein [Aureispira anguillae]|uniref:Uncharacterized protein n=1 Tax=Aureispira anguillae TaxID=2864201 RepID=A0A915YM70_9BACT|nr:hypothetical protein [Aureispira anguillae]BDS15526.1 hypothetical protein AsAng_0063100 [Aureispira anguillae]